MSPVNWGEFTGFYAKKRGFFAYAFGVKCWRIVSNKAKFMEKCKGDLPREFYIRMTKKLGWSKKRTIVEYALKNSNKPIAVANYRITSTLPKELRKELPGPEQIQRLLAEI